MLEIVTKKELTPADYEFLSAIVCAKIHIKNHIKNHTDIAKNRELLENVFSRVLELARATSNISVRKYTSLTKCFRPETESIYVLYLLMRYMFLENKEILRVIENNARPRRDNSKNWECFFYCCIDIYESIE